eukprot:1419437-Alexandrium_andersonii.AAC.1
MRGSLQWPPGWPRGCFSRRTTKDLNNLTRRKAHRVARPWAAKLNLDMAQQPPWNHRNTGAPRRTFTA